MRKLGIFLKKGFNDIQPDGEVIVCPEGYTYNESSKICEKDGDTSLCPEGYTLDLFTNQCIKLPDSVDMSDVPEDACYMQPNEYGDFTQQMFDQALYNGCKYIVLDADVWNIIYKDSPLIYPWSRTRHKIKLSSIQRTVENAVTIDCRKCFINCYHDRDSVMDGHYVFYTVESTNINIRFNHVEGDKYKRLFTSGTQELMQENTIFLKAGAGSINIKIDGNYVSGFMADAVSGSLSPSVLLNFDPKYYPIEGSTNLWKTENMPLTQVNNLKYGTLSFSTGNGYNRIPNWDMFNYTTVFLDENNIEISRDLDGGFLKTTPIPINARKVYVIVKSNDGYRLDGTATYRLFGFPYGYAVNSNLEILNTSITDNHRGGLANLGAYAVVDNCSLYNNQRYWDTVKFGDSTRYEINCEDSISRDLQIKNCTIKGKFHNILLVANFSADLFNNDISSAPYSIVIYSLIKGKIYGNNFSGESSNILITGDGNNEQLIKVYNNTGKVTLYPSYAAEIYNNTFINSSIQKYFGLVHDNVFINFNFSYALFTKDIYNNTFIGMQNINPYIIETAHVYKNNFSECYFLFMHGSNNGSNVRLFELCSFSGKKTQDGVVKKSFQSDYSNLDTVFLNCDFDGQTFYHKNTNTPVDKVRANWYFKDCNFNNMEGVLFTLYTNVNKLNNTPINIFFSNCTFDGIGKIISYELLPLRINVKFHNCTIDSRITLPSEYDNTDFLLPEKSKDNLYPNFKSIYNSTKQMVSLSIPFATCKMMVRNNTTKVTKEFNACRIYNYYLDGQDINDIEFSLNHGYTWQKPTI